ncbi:MAG: histidine phosphatase family protein, partial [Actinobacteria bacterium]|nr:histidine phosphatase family protein [Actinomycetota bacterium]
YVRHGSTAHSHRRLFSGHNDLPLDAVGRRQAEDVAALIADLDDVDVVLTSPLRRARETAEAIAGRDGLDVEVVDGLIEVDYGRWEGLRFAEVQARWPDELDAWLTDETVAPPEGESFASATRRVQALLADLLRRYPRRRVVAVSHVTPIKTALRLALGAPHETIFRFHLEPASLSVVDYYADGGCDVKMLNRGETRY